MHEHDPRWDRPRWPWELELLVLACVLIAVLGPWLVYLMSQGAVAGAEGLAPLSERVEMQFQIRQEFLWVAFILVLYFGHLVLSVITAEFITVSASHLLAPVFFTAIGYFRLSEYNATYHFNEFFFQSSAWEALGLMVGIQCLVWYCARMRMQSHLRRFRDVHWQVMVPSRRDRSWLRLVLSRIVPLFYPPQYFRACPEGLLVEGYSYVMPIPFYEVEYIFPVKEAQMFAPGLYLATSAHDLIGLKLFEADDVVFITPQQPTAFFKYCETHIAHQKNGEGAESRSRRRNTGAVLPAQAAS